MEESKQIGVQPTVWNSKCSTSMALNNAESTASYFWAQLPVKPAFFCASDLAGSLVIIVVKNLLECCIFFQGFITIYGGFSVHTEKKYFEREIAQLFGQHH